MARRRRNSGWVLRQKAKGGTFTVRFWIGGRESERSTGTSDRAAAAVEAARIYANEVKRVQPKRRQRPAGGQPLEELVGGWLVSLATTHDAGTCKTWELYARTHWLEHFAALHDLIAPMCLEYMRARLGKVQAETVRKELSALRSFLRWLEESGFLSEPVEVPSVPKRTVGTVYEKRRRSAAIELSPDECEAMLSSLDEWSASKRVPLFPIRARFVVGYDTSLRPSTLDALSVPRHYRSGAATISLTRGVDKSRWNREVPLTRRAREALDGALQRLDEVARAAGRERHTGPIFGAHDYRPHMKAAASAALPKDRAALFAGTHLRSARITHALEKTGNLPGVQHLAGHKLAVTTSRYVRASLRAAMDVVRQLDPKPKKTRAKRSG